MIRPLLSLVIAVFCFFGSAHAQLNPVLTPPSSVGWVPNAVSGGSHVLFTSQGTMINMPNGNIQAFLESPGLFDIKAGGGLPVGTGLATRTVPVTLAGKVTLGGVVKAVGTIAGTLATNPYVALGLVAAPYIYDWFNRAGVKTNPDGTFSVVNPLACISNCYFWSSPLPDGSYTASYESPQLACDSGLSAWTSFFQGRQTGSLVAVDQIPSNPGLAFSCVGTLDGTGGRALVSLRRGTSRSADSSTMIPSTLSEVQTKLATVQPDPNVIKEIFTIDQTGRYSDQLLKDLSIQNVVASGPATVSGPTTTTANPATPTAPASTTTAKTDYNCSYVMADVTCTKTVTTSNQQTGTDPATGQPYAPSAPSTKTQDAQVPDSASDTPLPAVPKLYTLKYPDGLTGVWTAKKALLMASPLLHLIPDLMPRLGSSAGYPTFPIPVVIGPWNFGTYDVSPAGYVWDFIKLCVLITTAYFVRAVIFGG